LAFLLLLLLLLLPLHCSHGNLLNSCVTAAAAVLPLLLATLFVLLPCPKLLQLLQLLMPLLQLVALQLLPAAPTAVKPAAQRVVAGVPFGLRLQDTTITSVSPGQASALQADGPDQHPAQAAVHCLRVAWELFIHDYCTSPTLHDCC